MDINLLAEILHAGQPFQFRWDAIRSKRKLIQALLVAPEEIRQQIEAAAHTKMQTREAEQHRKRRERENKQEAERENKRRKRETAQQTRALRQCTLRPPHVEDDFLEPVDPATARRCIGTFLDRTINASLALAVCAVCAGEQSAAQVKPVPFHSLPNRNQLVSRIPHPDHAHDLVEGTLLHPGPSVTVCTECLSYFNTSA